MKKSVLAILLCCLFSCKEQENQIRIPEGILSMDSMALLLRDIHQLESGLMVSGIRQDSAQVIYRALEPGIFNRYKLDTGRINRSLRFYASSPVLLDSLYHLVLHKTDSAAVFNP